MMARSRHGSTNEAEDTTAVRPFVAGIWVTLTATALRARQGPAAAFGGALRAALTRAHAVASVQLRDEGRPSSRHGDNFFERSIFFLTEESRYGVRAHFAYAQHTI